MGKNHIDVIENQLNTAIAIQEHLAMINTVVGGMATLMRGTMYSDQSIKLAIADLSNSFVKAVATVDGKVTLLQSELKRLKSL